MKILCVILTVLLMTGCTSIGKNANDAQQATDYMQISEDEAIEFMEENTGYIILDVRTEEEFAQKHIPGAINIPNEEIGKDEIAELPDKEQIIMVYCRSGNRSKQAAKKLVEMGYTNVVEFGGINNWQGEVVGG